MGCCPRGLPLHSAVLPHRSHSITLPELFPCLPDYGTGHADGDTGIVQYDGSSGSGTGHWSTAATNLKRRLSNSVQQHLYRRDTQREQIGKTQGEQCSQREYEHGKRSLKKICRIIGTKIVEREK